MKAFHRKTNWAATVAAWLFMAGCTVWFAYLIAEELAK